MSNAAQGIDREPEPKIGPAANAIMRRGDETRRGQLVQEIRLRNTMRQNMARQRFGSLGQQKEDAIARALRAAKSNDLADVQAQAIAQALKTDPKNPPPPSRRQRGPDFER